MLKSQEIKKDDMSTMMPLPLHRLRNRSLRTLRTLLGKHARVADAIQGKGVFEQARRRSAAALRGFARILDRAADSLVLPPAEKAARVEIHALVRHYRAATATVRPRPMRRPALYTRTRRGGQEAVEQQRARLQQCMADRGVTAVAEYSDVGYSANDRTRPGLQRLLADAERGLFDSVLMIDAVRLARDLKLYAELDMHLGKLGVAVHWPHSLSPAAEQGR
jgi:hypothetical protein